MAISSNETMPTVTMDTATATPIPSKESESKEYSTLVNCTPKLVTALRSDDIEKDSSNLKSIKMSTIQNQCFLRMKRLVY